MDGTGGVQKPIEPGEEFEYRFVVPDAGTFWYHSHYNETVQLEKGMYGALIVEDITDPVFDGEKVIMIDDMKLTADYEFTEPSWFLPRLIERHDGRQGDTLLINGKENPSYRNSCADRWKDGGLSTHQAPGILSYTCDGKTFKIIGTDGGLIESPVIATEALITPGERLDIVVGPFEEGETFGIESL